jgi:hypothetical protein
MAGSRGESWWQPPKQFDASPNGGEPVWDEDDAPPVWDDPVIADAEDEPVVHEPLEDEVDLEPHHAGASIGWTTPTGNVTAPDSGNRRFLAAVALIVVATAIGVLFALTLAPSDDDGEAGEPTETTVPLAVEGATTSRPGELSPRCEAELTRVQEAERAYQRGSIHGQFTDMEGLVNSGKLAAPSTLFVVNNEVPGDPSVVTFAGISAREYADYLILPIPEGPCDTT